MAKILTLEDAKNEIPKIADPIILAGGCFDILHPGHIQFLSESKNIGGSLVVMLESDEKIAQIKGKNRPIHSHRDRAFILSHLSIIDYIVLLPFLRSDNEYNEVIVSLNPTYISVTSEDPVLKYVTRQAKLANAQVREVISRINQHASSTIIQELNI